MCTDCFKGRGEQGKEVIGLDKTVMSVQFKTTKPNKN